MLFFGFLIEDESRNVFTQKPGMKVIGKNYQESEVVLWTEIFCVQNTRHGKFITTDLPMKSRNVSKQLLYVWLTAVMFY